MIAPKEVAALFGLLRNVDYAALSHKTDHRWRECYPWFRFEPCEGCKAIDFEYEVPADLRPEMSTVYSWLGVRFAKSVAEFGSLLPDRYCTTCAPPLVVHPGTGSCVAQRPRLHTVDCSKKGTRGKCPQGQQCVTFTGWGTHSTCEIRCGAKPQRLCPGRLPLC